MKRIFKRALSFRNCALIALAVIVLLLSINVTNVYANSAQSSWLGVTASGAIVKGEDCPLQVLNENLTFDIQEFPSNYYDSNEDFLAYSGKVTAEYTFYNPADYTVNATLMFPFGEYPDYYYSYDDEIVDDTAKYDITVNDNAVEKRIRHTLNFYDFEIAADMSRLSDDYIEDSFFSPNMPVAIYYFNVSGITQTSSAYASVVIPRSTDKTKIMLLQSNGYSNDDGKVSVGSFVNNGDVLEVIVFGESVTHNQFQWTIYSDGRERKVVSGNLTCNEIKTQTTTFLDYVKTFYDAIGGVSEVDYYNAVVGSLNSNSKSYSGLLFGGSDLFNVNNQLLRWYEYNISVAPKGQIINTVIAPIYPSINLNYSSPVFGYEYYLSPASTWASFGTLNITVNTPYYITKSSLDRQQKTEDGYTYSFLSLPDGEFHFSMCAIENPIKNKTNNASIFPFVLVCIALCLVVLAVTCLIVRYTFSKRKKRKVNQ